MATFKKTLSGDSRYSITLEVVEQTPVSQEDIALKVSRVDYTLTATKSSGGGYYTSSKTNTVKVTLGGNVIVDKKIAYDFTGSTPKTITLASGTEAIKHNEDGTKTITCKGYFKDAENSLGSATASGNLKLTDLHKPPVINNAQLWDEQNSVINSWFPLITTFVANVSKKVIYVDAVAETGSSISTYGAKNGNVIGVPVSAGSYYLVLDFANSPLTIENGKVSIVASATDTENSTTTETFYFDNYVLYTKPTIVDSNTTARRLGQLTGDIQLVSNGSYFNESINGHTITPKISYRYKKKSDENFGSWVDIPDANVQLNNGTWSIEETISSIFDYRYSYDIEIKATDNLIELNNADNNNTPLSIAVVQKTIVVGEPTWTEYKDRVDFKRITRQKGEIYGEFVLYDDATGTAGNVTLSDSASNYSYLEVFYYNDSNDGRMSQKVYSPNGNTLTLNLIYDNGTNCFFFVKHYSISGTTMTAGTEFRWRIATSGNPQRATTSTNIVIYRVVGYK